MTRPQAVATSVLTALLFGSCLWPIITGERHTGMVAQAKQCMLVIQKSADSYAATHQGKYPATYQDLLPYLHSNKAQSSSGPLPQNPLAVGQDYLFNLPENVTMQLLNGKTSSLESIKEAGHIAYGVNPDRSQFVIVGFDNTERNGNPIQGLQGRVLVLTVNNKILNIP